MKLLPRISAVLELPERPRDLAQRTHNRITKEAVRETLEYMHKTTIEDRFSAGAASKYEHFKRNPDYLKRKLKRKGSAIDLIYSGKTKRHMTGKNYQIRVGGSASGGDIKGTLSMKFPFAAQARKKALKKGERYRNARTVEMAKELSRFTDPQAKEAVAKFNEIYADKLRGVNAGRKRRKIQITP